MNARNNYAILKTLSEYVVVLPACPHIQIFDFGGYELKANLRIAGGAVQSGTLLIYKLVLSYNEDELF